ncbi:MAG: hydrogenase nickel incorporation protein HypB [Coriobacteriales bacterium]|jgi:hydrogenase nickel incorporation protein HypB
MSYKTIDVHQSVWAKNDEIADRTRARIREQGTCMVNMMASPGAGKTTVLLRTIDALKDRFSIGVMEADIDYSIDAQKMEDAGVRTIQIHTGGECAMDAEMTEQALDDFPTEDLDLIFLENVGNLVCPAETDTGASLNVEILSIPEGDDKPLKYPLMFKVCHAVLVNKIDTREYFPFDDEAVVKRIHALNPDAEVFFISAKTGEGFSAWVDWIAQKTEEWKSSKASR